MGTEGGEGEGGATTLTFFPDQAVVSVVRVVGVPRDGAAAVSYYPEVEFCLRAGAGKRRWLAGVKGVGYYSERIDGRTDEPRNSWPKRPE